MLFERLFSDRLELPPPGRPLDRLRLPAGGGVYALAAEDGRLIQLLGAASIRRSAWGRLSPASAERSGRRASLREVARTLWWRPTFSAFENALVYLQVARQLLGPRYRKQLAFGPAWFACIDLGETFPRWTVSASPFGRVTAAAGPFTTRKACARFVEALEDLFDLCRYHDVLQQAPHGQRCAYYDMGKCPAPCDGTVGMDAYRRALEDSAAFATGRGTNLLDRLRQDMSEAAAALDFERAQRRKLQLELAVRTVSSEHRLATSVDALHGLIVQAGSGASRVRPFFFSGGCIEPGAEIHLRELEDTAETWLRGARASDKGVHVDDTYRTDCVWLISHFVSKRETAPGVYLMAHEIDEPAAVIAHVREAFSRSSNDAERTSR